LKTENGSADLTPFPNREKDAERFVPILGIIEFDSRSLGDMLRAVRAVEAGLVNHVTHRA